MTFEAVRALGREFQDLHESTMYRSPALKLGKRLVACCDLEAPSIFYGSGMLVTQPGEKTAKEAGLSDARSSDQPQ